MSVSGLYKQIQQEKEKGSCLFSHYICTQKATIRNLPRKCVLFFFKCFFFSFFTAPGFSLSFRLLFPVANSSVVIIPLRSGTVPMLLV